MKYLSYACYTLQNSCSYFLIYRSEIVGVWFGNFAADTHATAATHFYMTRNDSGFNEDKFLFDRQKLICPRFLRWCVVQSEIWRGDDSCSRGLHPTNPPQLQQGFAPNQPTSDADFIILPTFLRNFQYNFPDIFKTFSRHLSDFFQVPNISVWPTQIKHKH